MNLDFAALGKGTKVLLIAGLLLFIDSFLQWQQVSIGFVSVGQNEWHGIGVLAALLSSGALFLALGISWGDWGAIGRCCAIAAATSAALVCTDENWWFRTTTRLRRSSGTDASSLVRDFPAMLCVHVPART